MPNNMAERESLQTPEQLVLRLRFADVEREKIVGDEGKIFVLSGTTVSQQRVARGAEPSFWYVIESLFDRPSRKGQEVAIFTDPSRFFVADTFGEDTNTQEVLVRAAGRTLGKKLGLPNIAGILTEEVATWSDLTFQYLGDPENKTGIWLFGSEYAKAQGKNWVSGRTKNPTNASGSFVAMVGSAPSGNGVHVSGWGRDRGDGLMGGPLLVVPIGN